MKWKFHALSCAYFCYSFMYHEKKNEGKNGERIKVPPKKKEHKREEEP